MVQPLTVLIIISSVTFRYPLLGGGGGGGGGLATVKPLLSASVIQGALGLEGASNSGFVRISEYNINA